MNRFLALSGGWCPLTNSAASDADDILSVTSLNPDGFDILVKTPWQSFAIFSTNRHRIQLKVKDLGFLPALIEIKKMEENFRSLKYAAHRVLVRFKSVQRLFQIYAFVFLLL